MNSQQLHRLATRPADYTRFLLTGQVPRGVQPTGPLVDLMTRIGPGFLAQIIGVTVDSRLGYRGSRRFQFGSQALRWIAPAAEVFGTFPAQSWRDPRFVQRLYLEDLAACCAQFPQSLYARLPRLCRPRPGEGPRP